MDYLPRHMGEGCCELRPEHKFAAFDTLMYQWRFKTELQSEKSMLELLAYYRVRNSGDPRDKVYALLGLASTKFRQLIKVDYRMPKEVRHLKCLDMMTMSIDLRIIRKCSRQLQ